MIRLCKILTSKTSPHMSWLLRNQRSSLSPINFLPFSSINSSKPNQPTQPSNNYLIDESVIQETIQFIKKLSNEDNTHYQVLFDKYSAAKELSSLAEEERQTLADIFNNMGIVYHEKNKHSDALRFFLQGSNMVVLGLLKKTIELAFFDMRIASIYFQMSNLEKAEEFLDKVVKPSPDIADDEDFQLLLVDAKCLRARIMLARGQKEQAKNEFEAIKLLIKKLPTDSQPAFVKTAYINVGDIYFSQNNTQLAIDNYKEGLKKVVEYNGEEGQETEELYVRLAQTFSRIKSYSEALEYAQKGSATDMKLRGKQGLISLDCLLVMRNVHFSLGEYDKCLDKSKELVKLLESLSPQDKPYLLSTCFMMVAASLIQKDSAGFKEHYEIALKRLHEHFSEGSLELANACIEYADFLRQYSGQGHVGELKVLYLEASGIFVKSNQLGKYLSAMSKLAQVSFELGNYDEAVKHLESSLEKIPPSGTAPREAEDIHASLCEVYTTKGQNEQVIKHVKKAAEVCKAHNNSSGFLSTYYMVLSEHLEMLKDFKGAENTYREILKLPVGEQRFDQRVIAGKIGEMMEKQKK